MRVGLSEWPAGLASLCGFIIGWNLSGVRAISSSSLNLRYNECGDRFEMALFIFISLLS